MNKLDEDQARTVRFITVLERLLIMWAVMTVVCMIVGNLCAIHVMQEIGVVGFWGGIALVLAYGRICERSAHE